MPAEEMRPSQVVEVFIRSTEKDSQAKRSYLENLSPSEDERCYEKREIVDANPYIFDEAVWVGKFSRGLVAQDIEQRSYNMENEEIVGESFEDKGESRFLHFLAVPQDREISVQLSVTSALFDLR
ncbi:hypothetical protein BTVI_144904 [Pitangus sulphuratus]|nr:hypothetical protein BTVI_144904 [Pitangus sulphuratus]